MLGEGAITTFEGLEQWFKSNEDHPFWTLYHGAFKGRGDICASNRTISDMNMAFSMLVDQIKIQSRGGGIFRIFQAPKARSNQGFNTTLRISDSIQGIHGTVSNNQGMVGFVAKNEVAEMVQKERETWEKEKKIEELESAVEDIQNGSRLDRIVNRLLDSPNFEGIVVQLCDRFLGAGSGAAISGFDHVNSRDSTSSDPEEQMSQALAKLQTHFPDIVEFIEGLASYVECNPEMAKTLFKAQILKGGIKERALS